MLNETTVSQWMSQPVVTIRPEAAIGAAQQMMKKYNIRRLVVVNEHNQMVGIVTYGDVREANPSDATTLSIWEINYLWSQLTIARIMTHEVVTINVDQKIVDAATLMLKHKISGVPVINHTGDLVGILTESDIFRMIVESETAATV